MNDERVTMAEFLLILLVLPAPAVLAASAVLWRFLSRARPPKATPRALTRAFVVLINAILIYVLTPAVWIGVPYRFLFWPGTTGGDWPLMLGAIFFTPAILASAVVTMGTAVCAGLAIRWSRPRTLSMGERNEGVTPHDERPRL